MHSGMQVVEAAWAADDDDVGAGESKEATERTALALEGKPPRRVIPEDPAARDAAAPAAAADDPVTRGPLLTFFVTVTGTTILAATLLAFAHAAAIYTYVAQPAASAAERLEAAVRCYELLFCFGVVVVELELLGTDDKSILGRSWLARGLAYGFVGVMAFIAADDDAGVRGSEQRAPAAWRHDALLPYGIYLRFCAAAMVGAGALYALLGLLCCRGLKKHAEAEYRKRLAQAELTSALHAELAIRGGPVANPV